MKPAFAAGELILSRFRIVRPIGSGGMGEVYEATDLELGRVALNHSPRNRRRSHASPASGKRFSSLAKSADRRYAAFTSCMCCRFIHRLTTRLHQHGISGWRYSHRQDLRIRASAMAGSEAYRPRNVTASRPSMTPGSFTAIFKSRNIMLASRNGSIRAVVMDFGLASEIPSPTSETVKEFITANGPVGTPGYMAPRAVHLRCTHSSY